MRTRFWIGLGLLAFGGYMAYKSYRAIGLMLGIWHPIPAKAAVAKIDLGPYPFAYELAQDTEASWYNPANVAARVDKVLAKPMELRKEALKAAGGDAGKAMDRLFEKSKDPDGAQALFESMRELAVQGSSTPTQKEPKALVVVKPLYTMKEGEAGIVLVARVAEKLQERIGKPGLGHFDQILMEDAIRLMGFYGAPQVPDSKKAEVPGGGKAAPIDPVVKGVLRAFLKGGKDYTQALASKALGQLGDAETADDLIKHPKDYPAASIADFGRESVEKWKENRLKLLKSGRGGEDAAFWQGVRLTPKYQDVAIDLAMAGDGGAGMAMERNIALDAYRTTDKDTRMARALDTVLRFPGTREAWVAHQIISGGGELGFQLGRGPMPKTREAFLRGFEHDLQIVFKGDTTWRPRDLAVLEGWPHLPTCLIHYRAKDFAGWEKLGLESFFAQIEMLFRKHYKNRITYEERDMQQTGEMGLITDSLSLFGRHLGLNAVRHPRRAVYVESRLRDQKDTGKYTPTDEMKEGQWWIGRNPGNCVQYGHIKSLEDF